MPNERRGVANSTLMLAQDLGTGAGAATFGVVSENLGYTVTFIAAGLITRMSWAFTVDESDYDPSEHTYIIKKVGRIYDVSAVSVPADPNTDISARNLLDGVIKLTRRESARQRKHQEALAAIAISKSFRKR